MAGINTRTRNTVPMTSRSASADNNEEKKKALTQKK
jgi:hypothetical protein